MTGGKAHGANRQYQVACRDVLTFRNLQLVPWLEDGIDVPFNLPDTCWTFDVGLRDPLGTLRVAECRRAVGAVKQEAMAAPSLTKSSCCAGRSIFLSPGCLWLKSLSRLAPLRSVSSRAFSWSPWKRVWVPQASKSHSCATTMPWWIASSITSS